MLEIITGDQNRVGEPGRIYVAIQCGCDWSVIVSDPSGRESHHDLHDAAVAELDQHLLVSETDACRPWIRR